MNRQREIRGAGVEGRWKSAPRLVRGGMALALLMVAFVLPGVLQARDLFVSSESNDRVIRYDGSTGVLIGDFVSGGSGGLDAANGLTYGPDGHIYVVSLHNDSVIKYDGDTGALIGNFVSSGSGGLDFPFSLEFGPDGNLSSRRS